ncbi:AAA family ATPase [Gloeobacter morelensis]|uniref:AAA family ATPase n=1 Tax=Gloeobacter morelensis MG652769 TaxID=2781736 RepID=A0ABY3PS36_9CYAN|nr:AAA family ATPase [Gloeobacter morelensis]UFP96527.1 AAA family ATPase [Gloeobacter morelensis MG652769]
MSSNANNPLAKGLLGAGWRPLGRSLDWEYLGHLALRDTWKLSQKTLDIASDLADALSRRDHPWWANLLNVFSENMQYELDEYWDYITPEPTAPDYRFKDTLSIDRPVVQAVGRESIPIDYVLNRLQETVILRILALLGRPDSITQYYLDRHFEFPVEQFVDWDRMLVPGTLFAYWSAHQVWLKICLSQQQGKQQYSLIAIELLPLINKTAYNLAVMLSGYQSRIGRLASPYPIRSFPPQVQAFTDAVQQAVLDGDHLAVLVHGEPGTGKTAWAQAVAKEILQPLGFVTFILDHDAVENFAPPAYLERVCLIVNEADNLAQNRASEVAQASGKTEHILGLLDGTLYRSVVDESGLYARQKLVVVLTCNTTERLDPAVLRKGRVDLISQFTYRFV